MNEIFNQQMTRRQFSAGLVVSAAAIGLSPVLSGCTPSEYQQQVVQLWSTTYDMSDHLLEVVKYATLAPSGHNTQPWKFSISEDEIVIFPDLDRHLAIVDPEDRELYISLGCALENLVIAASQLGYQSQVDYQLDGSADQIVVKLLPEAAAPDPLFSAIQLRQSVRSKYDGKPVSDSDLQKLKGSLADDGVFTRFVSSAEEMEAIRSAIKEADNNQYSDKSFINELIEWLRFTEKDAVKTKDGLFSKCSGNPEVPAFIGRLFVASSKPEDMAKADLEKLDSSAGCVLISTATDQKDAWVKAGRTFQRLALTATQLNIKTAFLNQPIEIDALRTKIQTSIALDGAFPQLFFRYGYAAEMPRSLRRPVDEVVLS